MMNTLELKIPPPIVALFLALLMWLAAFLTDPVDGSLRFRVGLSIALIVIGQGISLAGMLEFRRVKTTVNPLLPHTASTLVTSGIYRFTRNPMYVGLLLTLLAWAAFLSNPSTLVMLPFYVLYISRFQIVPEEQALTSRFGADYVAYQTRVRRWI